MVSLVSINAGVLPASSQSAGGVGGLLFATLHPSGKTFAYGTDLNGNVTLLVNTATGQPAATYDYGPFGEPLRESGEYASLNPFRFSTKYADDETGVVNYEHRPYLPAIGRWLSEDPAEEQGGMNLYEFVRNDGVNQWDVLGLFGYSELGIAESILKQSNLSAAIKTQINSFRFQGHGDFPNYQSDGHDGRGKSVSDGFDWTLADNKEEYKNKHPYHFLSTGEAQAQVDEAIKMGKRTEFELYMHSL